MRMRIRKPTPVDVEHMQMLHKEAVEQLDLMHSVLEASGNATDASRDGLYNIAIDHWHAYLDVMHMICMHDNEMTAAMKKYSNQIPEGKCSTTERLSGSTRNLLLFLLLALTLRHRRFDRYLNLRGNPMNEYLHDSITMERDHIAELISMVEDIM